MFHRAFTDVARECGYETEDVIDNFDDGSGLRFDTQGQCSFDDEQFGGYMDEIVSSPSPAERRVVPSTQHHACLPESIYEDETMQYYEGHPAENYYNSTYAGAPQCQGSIPYGARMPAQPVPHRNYRYNDHDNFSYLQPSTHDYSSPSKHQQAHHNYTQHSPEMYPQNRFSQPSTSFAHRERQVPPPTQQIRGENPRNGHGIRLHPVSELSDVYRGIFNFGVFNAVQSTCFDTIMHSDENMVISAPTGSGKTVLFELSIIRMLIEARRMDNLAKCVYIAPTKALCSERHKDWTTKFDGLGVKCCELTGDTVTFGKSAWGDAKDASIIITTGEKWDSLTRNWSNHEKILSHIQLFLVDEVHILNEMRGSTLEVVVSRMKTRGSAVRFLLVSATVPNIDDVARWIGGGDRDAARVFQFGEEFRPCKLTRVVYGVRRGKDQNDFAYAKTLDYRLFAVLQQHAVDKPILVFCATRNGCFTTANQMAKEYEEAKKTKQTLPWKQPNNINQTFHDSKLTALAAIGIGVHHAGMNMDDRRSIETLYIQKILRIVIATSTLAVGVNLPAHTVVIKGVKTFINNASTEYSDLDIVQMMGRAGRPQFDKDGVAIILCENELEAKYKALAQGKTILESCLHLNLSEHLNSEIGLGTITSLDSAKLWLRQSFLFQRIQRNPAHYALGKEAGQSWQERIDDLVMQSVTKLQKTELVEYAGEGGDGELSSTEYGDIMSKFYIKQTTMNLILQLSDRASVREILEMISSSEEFTDLKIRAGEKSMLNKLKQHDDIRFQVKKVEKLCDKVFLLIQAILGGISLSASEYKSPDSQPYLEALSIFRHVARIARAVMEVGIVKKSGAMIKHGFELIRCLNAKAWEDRPVVLRQIEQIGEKSLKVLTENGITSLAILLKQDPFKIETLLNRRSPFGFEVLASAQALPQYFLKIQEIDITTTRGEKAVEIELSIECGLYDQGPTAAKAKKHKGLRVDMTSLLTLTSDLAFIDFRRISTKSLKQSKTFQVTAHLTKPSQSVSVIISSESFAGLTITQTFKPQIDAKEYPTMDTRPKSSLAMDIAEFESDPNFWVSGTGDEDDKETVVEKDVTKDKKNGSKPNNCKTITGKKPPNLLQTLDEVPIKPKKLPNGNYECHHTCRDKTICRHLCCRDGLLEPPKPLKKFNKSAESPQVSQHKNTNRPQPKPKLSDKPDSRLKHLEILHQDVGVNGNLMLAKGQRLKLQDNTSPLKRSLRPVPNFDLKLVDLTDDLEPPNPTMNIDDDDDDDLPEPLEVLNSIQNQAEKRRRSSDDNYSNSEIDALIREAPLDVPLKSQDPPPSLDPRLEETLPPTPLQSSKLKRASTAQIGQPATKRARFRDPAGGKQDSSPSLSYGVSGTSTKDKSQKKIPLFLAESSDDDVLDHEDSKPNRRQDASISELNRTEDGFRLDYSLFDILPATPPLTASTSNSNDYIEAPLTPVYAKNAFQQIPQSAMKPKDIQIEDNAVLRTGDEQTAPDICYEDDFAELDAFLQSGAVEFVTEM